LGVRGLNVLTLLPFKNAIGSVPPRLGTLDDSGDRHRLRVFRMQSSWVESYRLVIE
jgi:hypothetical protein